MTQTSALSFQIDSTEAVRGNEQLDVMKRRATEAEAALSSLARSASSGGSGFATFGAGLGASSSQLAQFAGSLQSVVGTLQAARSALDGTIASFASFEQARQRTEALSSALGTSAVSLEAFSRQASVFNMTSYETASALQRITMAIEGQTAAGRQLRALMQDYGVTLNGITSSNADQVLTRFVSQVRTMQTSPQNTQALQAVLGPLDTGALAAIQNPTLETVSAREARLRVQAVDRQIAELTDAASQTVARSQRNVAIMRDAEGTSLGNARGVPGAYDLSQLSADQMHQIAQNMGRRDLGSSSADRLATYNYLTNDAPDDLRTAARAKPSWTSFPIPYLSRLSYEYQGSGLQGFVNQFSDGRYAGRQSNIDAQYAEQIDPVNGDASQWGPGGFSGLIGGGGQYDTESIADRIGRMPSVRWAGRSVGNFFGFDMTKPLRGDMRGIGAPATFEQRQGVASGLADAGFGEISGRVSAEGASRHLQSGVSEKSPSDTLMRLIKAYQDEGGLDRGEAVAEGTSRYNNRLDQIDVAREDAIKPGAAQLSQIATQGWIMRMAPDQRSNARSLLEYSQQQGVSTTRWADRNMSVDDISSGQYFGAGNLSPNQAEGFKQIRTAQDAGDINASNDATRTAIQLQQQITAAIPLGSAALQQETAYLQARNTALRTNDGPVAEVIGQNARREAIAATNVEMEKSLDLLRKRTQAEDRTLAAMQAAGTDPAARAAAARTSGIENDVIAERLNGMGPDQIASYRSSRAEQFGNQAATFGSEQYASGSQALANQQRLADIAGLRVEQQQKLNREYEIEQTFVKALDEARGAPDPDAAVAGIQRIIAAMKDLGSQTDAVNSDAANRTFSRDANYATNRNDTLAGLTPSERHILDSMQPWLDQINDPQIKSADAQTRARLMLNPNLIQNPLSRQSAYDAQRSMRSSDSLGNVQADDQSGFVQRQNAAAAGAASQGPAASRLARAYTVGPNNNGHASEDAERRGAEELSALAAQRADADAAQNQEILNQQRLIVSLGQSAAAYERVKLEIAAENQQRQLGTIDKEAQMRDSLTLAIDKQTVAIGEQNKRLQDGIQLEAGRAEAYSRGRVAGEEFDRHAGTFTQTQALNAQAAAMPNDPQVQTAVTVQRGRLSAANTLSDRDAATLASSRYEKEESGRRDDRELMQADIDAGIYASPKTVADARNRVTAQRVADRTAGGDAPVSFDDALKSANSADALARTKEQVDQLRGAFSQMGDAVGDTFVHAMTHITNTRLAMHALATEIEEIILKSFVTKPLENALGNAASSAFGGIFGNGNSGGGNGNSASSSSGGGGGGGIGSGIGNWISNGAVGKATSGIWDSVTSSATWAAINPLNWFAQGGIIDRGMPTRYLAAGGLIDRPTTFYAAGGTVMAGEADTEAIMPLRRLPNGNLGIQSSGGGSGPMIMVHAPVTIQGGGNGQNGGMSPGAMKQLQRQMEQMHTAAIRSVMTNEKRDGGDLSGSLGTGR